MFLKKDESLVVCEFIFLAFFNPPCMFSASCISCCYTVQALSEDMGHFSLSADEQKAPSFVHTHFLKAPALQAQKSGGEKCFIDLGVRRHRLRTFLEMDRTLNLPVFFWGG